MPRPAGRLSPSTTMRGGPGSAGGAGALGTAGADGGGAAVSAGGVFRPWHAARSRHAHTQRERGAVLDGIDLYYRRRMARGFESKMVEFNQEEAARGRAANPETSPADRERVSRRRALELARTRAAADLERATAPAHQ